MGDHNHKAGRRTVGADHNHEAARRTVGADHKHEHEHGRRPVLGVVSLTRTWSSRTPDVASHKVVHALPLTISIVGVGRHNSESGCQCNQ